MSGISDQVVVTDSEVATMELAANVAGNLKAGTVILLSGDLGSGKTAFVRGLAVGLGIDPAEVTSPTFTLVHEYRGRVPLIHVDLYRLEKAELDEIGLDTDLAGEGVIAIEWPERLVRKVAGAISVHIDDKGDTIREITIADT